MSLFIANIFLKEATNDALGLSNVLASPTSFDIILALSISISRAYFL